MKSKHHYKGKDKKKKSSSNFEGKDKEKKFKQNRLTKIKFEGKDKEKKFEKKRANNNLNFSQLIFSKSLLSTLWTKLLSHCKSQF